MINEFNKFNRKGDINQTFRILNDLKTLKKKTNNN